jgi:hypothetical protein
MQDDTTNLLIGERTMLDSDIETAYTVEGRLLPLHFKGE